MSLVDFHNHYVPPRYPVVMEPGPRWKDVVARLSDEALLLRDIREGALQARVVNVPAALIDHADHDYVALNDELAELCGRHARRLYGLASVDAYDGERSAREVDRAVRDLGLKGVFVDCARGESMLDAPEARPTLEAAARLGVPVFVHPVPPQPMTAQMAPYGRIGALYARGTANAASLIALVEGGTLAELPGLRIVVTALALGGIAIASGLSAASAALMRRQVFMDTNIVDPGVLRASVALLGATNVVTGTDWPINQTVASDIRKAMQEAGLSEEEQDAIAGKNALRLLGNTAS